MSIQPQEASPRHLPPVQRVSPTKGLLGFVVVFFSLVLLLAVAEQLGLARLGIGSALLLGTATLYVGIGLLCRTPLAADFYVAGRRVPAVYNGMAAGAGAVGVTSFMSLAGSLYLSGYTGLAFVMGWTGGFCLVALLLAPYLRKFGQYTVPDFLGARYGGHGPRALGLVAAGLISFVLLVAQLYGLGLIAARLSDLNFEQGVALGLGCLALSMLMGGMRAVTWTQVAQFTVLIVAYAVPVVWISAKQTGNPVPFFVAGQQLAKVTAKERALVEAPAEREVQGIFKFQAADFDSKLKDVPLALASARAAAQRKVSELTAAYAPAADIAAAQRALAALPEDEIQALAAWTRGRAAAEARSQPLAGMQPHAKTFAGDPNGNAAQRRQFTESRRNFLALIFCLMVGTAGLPHILTRYYTTPSVKSARRSVAWSVFFVAVLLALAPVLAVLLKYQVFTALVGTPMDKLPSWIAAWSRVDPSLVSVVDINRDGLLQLGELRLHGDIMMLATPEIAGLPYFVSGLVAAGGMAAALSTASALLMTMANGMAHDTYYKMVDPNALTARRLWVTRACLLLASAAAAYVAAQKPPQLLFLVAGAFSLAGATFFPALVLGIFWKRANRWGAMAGMVAGLGLTLAYMVINHGWLRELFGVTMPARTWWGISPMAAGVYGVPFGFAVIVVVSLFTRAPDPRIPVLVDYLRYPRLGAARAVPRSQA